MFCEETRRRGQMSEISVATEEYLEGIFRLQEKKGVAKTSDIAELLRVVGGTVTNTVERLEKEDYVVHEPYKGVKLTEKGLRIALQVIRRHRLSERLLTDFMHVEWYKVHEVACKLEHGLADEIIEPLEEALGHPKTCPHGNPIPTKGGKILKVKSRPLASMKKGEQGTIVKITDENVDLLHYLDIQGLTPGVSVKVLERAPFNGPTTLRIGRVSHSVSQAIASIIQVKRTGLEKGLKDA